MTDEDRHRIKVNAELFVRVFPEWWLPDVKDAIKNAYIAGATREKLELNQKGKPTSSS